jgi:hypothetical protein
MTEGSLHPNLAIAHLNWADRHVVRPQVECATAFEIEVRVVPMTGQNAVLNAAALERETHVGATIIQGEDTPPIIEDEDRTMAPGTTSRPFAFNSSRLPASANSWFGASMSTPPVIDSFGAVAGTRFNVNIGFLSRKREMAPRLRNCISHCSSCGAVWDKPHK